MACGPTHLPDPRVLEPPPVRQPLEQLPHQRPDVGIGGCPVDADLVQRVEQLAVRVELELRRRRVPDSHRCRPLVAREPVELAFVEAALAGDPVHDLDVGRVAGHGAEQPLAPRRRLVVIAGTQHRDERERRVAEPAVAVVPIADPSDQLRQRRRRRRDHPPGWGVGERLQDEERLVHLLVVVALVPATGRPGMPVVLGLVEGLLRVGALRALLVRREPGEHERNPLARRDGERGDGGHVLAVRLDRRPVAEAVGSRDRDDVALEALHPRDDLPEVEANHQLGAHLDLAGETLDDPHDLRRPRARRHEVDQAHAAACRLDHRLEDQRVVPVAAGHPLGLGSRREQPPPVLRRPEDRGEARPGIESRKAAPVDRSLPSDERRRLKVPEQCVVLNRRHFHPLSRSGTLEQRA